jgi:hypothetical protein
VQEAGSGKILSVLKYKLKERYSQDFNGIYVHPKLVNAIAI